MKLLNSANIECLITLALLIVVVVLSIPYFKKDIRIKH